MMKTHSDSFLIFKQNVKNPKRTTFKIFNTVRETVKVKAETQVVGHTTKYTTKYRLHGWTDTKVRENNHGGKNTWKEMHFCLHFRTLVVISVGSRIFFEITNLIQR